MVGGCFLIISGLGGLLTADNVPTGDFINGPSTVRKEIGNQDPLANTTFTVYAQAEGRKDWSTSYYAYTDADGSFSINIPERFGLVKFDSQDSIKINIDSYNPGYSCWIMVSPLEFTIPYVNVVLNHIPIFQQPWPTSKRLSECKSGELLRILDWDSNREYVKVAKGSVTGWMPKIAGKRVWYAEQGWR